MSIFSQLLGLEEKRIFLIALILSMIIHVGGILILQSIFPGAWFRSNVRTYKVDLIRPPVEEIMNSKKEKLPAVSQIHTEPPAEPKEATISLDTKDSTYIPYAEMLKERIRAYWVYPLYAQENLLQGTLLILFRLDRAGNLVACKVVRPSEYEILDKYALAAIRSASPFPPFPENINVDFLNINASFAYQLQFE